MLPLVISRSFCSVRHAMSQANFAAARAIARVGGVALARNRVAIVRGVFSETAFSIVLASARGHMSQCTLLWTTNPILRIRTAGRRFPTKTPYAERDHLSAKVWTSVAMRFPWPLAVRRSRCTQIPQFPRSALLGEMCLP